MRVSIWSRKATTRKMDSNVMWTVPLCLLFFALTTFAHEESQSFALRETNMVQKLKNKLLIEKQYDKHVRPMDHHLNATVVEIKLSAIYLIDYDEELSLMTMDTWIFMMWEDAQLAWNENDFGGLKTINFGDGVLWHPDISVYNSHSSNLDPKGNTHSIVLSSGKVIWVPPATMTTHCFPEDLHLYPQDIQRCDVVLGSWTEHGYQLQLKLKEDGEGLDLTYFRDSNPRWEFLGEMANASIEVKYYNCCQEPYYSAKFSFYLKRRYPANLEVAFVPCILVILLTLGLFWIPLLAGKKVTFGAFLLLILTVLMVYVASTTKPMSAQVYAVSYIRSMMYVVTLAILAEIIVSNMASIRSPYRPPQFLLNLLSSSLAKWSLAWSPLEEADATDQDPVMENQKNSVPCYRHEWIMIATAMDRLLFIIFIIIFAAIHH